MNAPDVSRLLSIPDTRNTCRLPISNHFPPPVRDLLVNASHTPFDEFDPEARVRAVNRAIAQVRRHYPHLFRPCEVI